MSDRQCAAFIARWLHEQRPGVPSRYGGDMVEGRPLFEMDRLVAYDDNSLLTEVRRVLGLLPPGPVTRSAFDEISRVATSTLIRRFGSWRDVLARVDAVDRYGGRQVTEKMRDQTARGMDADEVIAELRRVAAVAGRNWVTREDVRAHSTILGDRIFAARFGSWNAAVAAAGLEVSPMGRRWTEEDYFENLLQVWTHHGRPPTYAEMNSPPSLITNGAYAAKFGSWGLAKEAFVGRVNSDVAAAGGTDVDAPRTSTRSPRPRQEDQRSIPIGLRYQVLRRDRFRCVTCGRSPASDLGCVLHVDHVLAFSRGGKTRLDNLRTLCAECNVGKSAGD